MTTAIETKRVDWPTFRIRDWLEPLDLSRFWDRTFEDHIRVEEEMVDGKLVIRAELPGIDPDKDVDIAIKDDMLTLRAERKQRAEAQTAGGFRSEFRYGSFQRMLSLPKGCTAADVVAEYKDGILVVTVPVPVMESEAHKVPVTKA